MRSNWQLANGNCARNAACEMRQDEVKTVATLRFSIFNCGNLGDSGDLFRER